MNLEFITFYIYNVYLHKYKNAHIFITHSKDKMQCSALYLYFFSSLIYCNLTSFCPVRPLSLLYSSLLLLTLPHFSFSLFFLHHPLVPYFWTAVQWTLYISKRYISKLPRLLTQSQSEICKCSWAAAALFFTVLFWVRKMMDFWWKKKPINGQHIIMFPLRKLWWNVGTRPKTSISAFLPSASAVKSLNHHMACWITAFKRQKNHYIWKVPCSPWGVMLSE